MQKCLLEMKQIRKSFNGNEVLHGVDFSCMSGEVHVLMGENGAGKSTLLKILTGVYHPDGGTIFVKDKPVVYSNTHMAQEIGVAMVYQELTMLPHMTVEENIFLNNEPRGRAGLIDTQKIRKETAALIEKYDLQISGSDLISDLPLAKRQMVEIMKLLIKEPDIIILDEPTSSLNRAEVEKLYEIIRHFKAQNKAVIFISHRMEEVFEIGDRITILKDGSCVGTRDLAEITADDIIRMMVGRELTAIFPEKNAAAGEEIFRVEGLSVGDKVSHVDLSVRKGEVIGIAGLQGHGQGELLEAVAGIVKASSGSLSLNGVPLKVSSPSSAIRAGIAYVSDDRKSQGLCLRQSVSFNLTLNSLYLREKLSFIQFRLEKLFVKESIDRFSIKVYGPQQLVENLSGGNQQKVVLGKVLAIHPKVLLVNEPTRGIDVNTKHEIYKLMRELASQGVAVIMYSTDLLEVIGMSDRVLVMYEGQISGELTGSGINEEDIMRLAVGLGKGGKGNDTAL